MISRRFSKPSKPIGEGGCSGAGAPVSSVNTVMVAEEVEASHNNRKNQQKQAKEIWKDFFPRMNKKLALITITKAKVSGWLPHALRKEKENPITTQEFTK